MASASSSTASAALHADRCAKLVAAVRQWDTLQMFHHPVTDAQVPGYAAVITSPIDLATIADRLASGGAYRCDTDVVNALQLMITNAITFNDPSSQWYAHAKALRKQLPSMVAGAALELDEEEEEYIEKGSRKERRDECASLRREEARSGGKAAEDMTVVLKGLQEDLDTPIEVLRQRLAAQKRAREEADAARRSRKNGAASASSSSSSAVTESSDGSSEDEDDDDEEDESSEEDEEGSNSDAS